MSNRTTLKSYFLTGATPTEANFADLIDSVLVLEEDLTDSLSLASSDLALTASAGKTLNDSLTSLTSRVVTLEGAESDFASNYYTKSESDAQIAGLNSTIDALPFRDDIGDLHSRLIVLEEVDDYPPKAHLHGINEIVDLSDELELKASIEYVQSLVSDINTTIAGLETGSDESAEVASLQAQVDTINTSISSLPTSEDLDAKSDTGHTHTVANITDISSSFYNKSETDTLLSNVVPKPHTHVEADITNLDKYTTGAVDLKLADHNTRTDNPHSVSAAQIGLDKVENLTVAEIFQSSQAQLLATKAELDTAVSGVDGHSSRTDNPHSVTKAQVGLSDVPNVNFQALLDNHLSATNPHNIDLSYFDVYSESETDARIQFYLDAFRYNFKPASETDGAGAVGDIAYHNTGLYFKFGPTEWRQVLTSKTFNDGSPGSSFQIDTPKLEVVNGNTTLFEVDNTTNTTSINTTNVDITGQVSLGSGLTTVGAVSLGNTLNVSGNTVLSTLRATTVTTDSINSGSGTIQTTGQLKGGATTVTSLNAGSGSISTTGTISTGGATVTSLSAGSGDISTTGAIKGGTIQPNNTVRAQTGDLILEGKVGDDVKVNDKLQVTGNTTVGTSSTNANLVVNGNTTVTGNLTIQGTTTSIDTTNLVIEDNIVVLNKNQTGTPPGTLKSGIEVERGDAANVKFFWDESDDQWKAIVGGQTKTISFSQDLGTAAPLDVAASGDASAGQVVKGNDSRLTDTRDPKSHTHGNISNDGKIGSAANKPVITTTGGVVTAGSFGTTANTFCQGNDARLSNARTPVSHTHPISQVTGLRSELDTYLTQSEIQALLYSK